MIPILPVIFIRLPVIYLAYIILLLPVSISISAQTLLPDDVLRTLSRQGQGTFRYLGMRIYDATLYVDTQNFSAVGLADSRYALSLEYARALDGEKIAERSAQEITRQTGASDTERMLWLSQMKALFPNVKKGDQLLGVHIPGKGTAFYLNSRYLGSIEGRRFAQYFFGIWLDERTSAPDLRSSLLNVSSAQALDDKARQ